MSRAAATRLSFALVLLTLFFAPHRVLAGGLEYTAAGSTALGRGGAVAARADDPMVLAYNPAGLVELRGTQLLLNANVALMNACVDPIGYYGWGAYGGGGPTRIPDAKSGGERIYNLGVPPTNDQEKKDNDSYYFDELDTVCLDQHIVPIPQLIFTSRISEDFGIGGGFVFPSISPTGQWGGEYGVIRGDTGELRPAPTRYMMLNTGNLGVFPNLGAAYRVTKWLRVGAAFEWGIVWIDTTTMAGVGTGTSPSNDVIAHIRGRDTFVPAFTGSVHVVPTDNLDFVAAFRYQDSIKAPGTLNLTTGVFDAKATPRSTRGLKVTSINQDMPWKLRLGARYSDRLVPRPTGTGGRPEGGLEEVVRDYLQDERWDVEFDVEYQMNSRNQRQQINYAPNQLVEFEAAESGTITMAQFPDSTAPNTIIEKHWKDQVSLRAGGSYNLVPGLFGMMAGAHYETRGIDPAYMQIDFWPVSRLGFHGGITFRVSKTTDFVFSYAHIFQETLVVAPPPHLDAKTIYANTPFGSTPKNIDRSIGIAGRGTLPEQQLKNPPKNPDGVASVKQATTKNPSGQPPWIINSGTYRSDMDVFSVGFIGHY
jgi:long-subunit fatty acid transport protein